MINCNRQPVNGSRTLRSLSFGVSGGNQAEAPQPVVLSSLRKPHLDYQQNFAVGRIWDGRKLRSKAAPLDTSVTISGQQQLGPVALLTHAVHFKYKEMDHSNISFILSFHHSPINNSKNCIPTHFKRVWRKNKMPSCR